MFSDFAQTSPTPPTKKEVPKHELLVKGPFGLFQGSGEILDACCSFWMMINLYLKNGGSQTNPIKW